MQREKRNYVLLTNFGTTMRVTHNKIGNGKLSDLAMRVSWFFSVFLMFWLLLWFVLWWVFQWPFFSSTTESPKHILISLMNSIALFAPSSLAMASKGTWTVATCEVVIFYFTRELLSQTVITVKFLTFLKCTVFLVAMLHLLVRAIAAINVSLSPIGFPFNSSSA